MTPTKVFESYWRFAAERHAMFTRRLESPSGPWTNDPVLAAYRFTNAYRANDRVTQYLISEVQYRFDRPSDPSEVFFRTILFKLFNRIDTWEELEARLGPLRWTPTVLESISSVLDERWKRRDRLYSAAYIMPSPQLGYERKHANHIGLLAQMMADSAAGRIAASRNLREIYLLLLGYSGIGPFLAYQFTIDLNYAAFLDHDEAGFVVAGPGALDGISKCFSETNGKSPEDVILAVCDSQSAWFRRLGLTFPGLFGRQLQPIDCQNLFCEISKYARIVHPDVAGIAGRTRIKQGYRKDPRPLPTPKYPPRWNVAVPPHFASPSVSPPDAKREVQPDLWASTLK